MIRVAGLSFASRPYGWLDSWLGAQQGRQRTDEQAVDKSWHYPQVRPQRHADPKPSTTGHGFTTARTALLVEW
ncbi:hypothetical protein CRD60_02990 [Bifidobacterium aemilianum]|uniref:Uncharacterized protein n=1 Tax=Bifidobacterium aemilianum TaxID=2493120 RepID=A0A366KAJ6_9BIFI|nr:hypothetical protein CRD60_02990 [Bifidobacterium aemilianum]